jgi:hypothetical protein
MLSLRLISKGKSVYVLNGILSPVAQIIVLSNQKTTSMHFCIHVPTYVYMYVCMHIIYISMYLGKCVCMCVNK